MKLNQNGFGAIEGLLVVIALTLIVGVGFYVVNTSSNEVAKPTNTKRAAKQIPQKTDEELIIEAVKKEGTKNADGSTAPPKTVTVTSIVGNNAKGSAGFGGVDGGYAYIAHKTNGNWEVIFRGQQLPGKDIGEKYNLPADWYSVDY